MVAGGHLGAGGQGMGTEQGGAWGCVCPPAPLGAWMPGSLMCAHRMAPCGLGLCPQKGTSTHRIAEVPQPSQPLHHLGALQREGVGLRQAACE